MIIDLHTHLIPGVDDGAQNIDDSVKLAKEAVSQGIEHIVLTPHHRNNQFVNHASGVIEATERLQTELNQRNIPLNVYPGQEIRINKDMMDDLLNRNLLSLDDSGKYYLIEFPTATVPDYSERMLGQLIHRGITPVIAHPERNHVFVEDIAVYARFIEMGCLGQITTSSIAGAFGEKIQQASIEMIQNGWAHILASDAHSVEWRPFNTKVGFEALENYFGSAKVTEFKENARSIFNGEDVKPTQLNKKHYNNFNQRKSKKKSFWDLFK